MFSVYINEKSLCGQITPSDWQGCLAGFKDCIKILKTCDSGSVTAYYTPLIYNSEATIAKHTFGSLLDRDTKVFLKGFLQKINRWDVSPLTEQEKSYIYRDVDYYYTSVSEAFERSALCNTALLNFVKSTFEDGTITVEKDSSSRDIKSYSTSDQLTKLLVESGALKHKYDKNSTHPPRDYETILSDTSLFKLAENEPLQNNRKVYKRIDADEFWYVDNYHFGNSAHLEVFDAKSRKQIAVSRVNSIDFFRELKSYEKNRSI